MSKRLELIDTKDKFSLKIDGNEIPFITEYTITAKAESSIVELGLKLAIPNEKDIIIESEKAKVL
ncbi:MAG TPA: hypothetical protein VK031_07690 [Tissierellaceae bacterium]|nr:hypothetical protein [Tissierellaceae bacterium]